ncbi:phage holin [Ligilactobacillus animalis]|uniref:phage holin n=1 Tax=Ligilactobacillus animalis TaxID=1605 RepID=UPI0010A59249|nr:phage holin [Ligilactobacillus animalis]MDO5884237.1 phage holin [Ligilactobacillus animalis]THE20240.1 phage holin, LL-H family protein [Ligilactobacillus animalis]THE21440.1 phage holin, LL-H family protein [Ligilactobacillus animalis]
METNELIVTVLATILTTVISYCGHLLAKNSQALTILRAIEPLAKDAVIAAQKLGVTQYLSGAMKKNHAVQAVAQALLNAGFTVKDEQVIKNAVEKAYAEQKELLAQYPQKTKEG